MEKDKVFFIVSVTSCYFCLFYFRHFRVTLFMIIKWFLIELSLEPGGTRWLYGTSNWFSITKRLGTTGIDSIVSVCLSIIKSSSLHNSSKALEWFPCYVKTPNEQTNRIWTALWKHGKQHNDFQVSKKHS